MTSCQAKTADGVKQRGPDVPEGALHPAYLDAQTPKGTPLGVFVILKVVKKLLIRTCGRGR